MNTLALTLSDGVTIARRNVIKIRRVPQTLVAVLVSPLLMVVMFHYIFGSSIEIPGVSYDGFLISGAFAMILVFGSTFTGAGLVDDLQKGIIDRFRSLPMSRSAVIVGRTVTDVIYNLLSLMVMALAGLAVGWRINNGLDDAVLAFVLLLAFAYAFSWIMAYVGLVVPQRRGGQQRRDDGDLPPDLHLQRLRPRREPGHAAADLRAVEPDLGGDAGIPGTARQRPGHRRRANRLVPAAPGRLHVAVTILIIAIFAPLSIRRFSRS